MGPCPQKADSQHLDMVGLGVQRNRTCVRLLALKSLHANCKLRALYCRLPGNPPRSGRAVQPPSYFHRITLKDYLGALVGILLTSFVITFAMILPVLLCRGDEPYTYYDAGAETTEEDMRRAYEAAKVASYDTALTSYSTADTAGGKGQAGQAGNGKVAGAALGEGVEREGDEGGSGDGATGPGADLEAGQQVGEAQGLVPGVRAPGTALTEGSGSSLADGGGVGVQLAPAGAGAGAGLACSGQGAGTRGESSLKRRREDKDQPPQQQELGGHGVGEQGVGERDAAQLLRAGALAGIRSSQAAVVEAFGSSALQPYLWVVGWLGREWLEGGCRVLHAACVCVLGEGGRGFWSVSSPAAAPVGIGVVGEVRFRGWGTVWVRRCLGWVGGTPVRSCIPCGVTAKRPRGITLGGGGERGVAMPVRWDTGVPGKCCLR